MSEDLIPDRRALGAVFKDARLLLAIEGLFRKALIDTPGAIAEGELYPNFVTAFGGVGDGATNNDTAFLAAEADPNEWIWLPAGEYVSTLPQSTFTKHYLGPGKIMLAGYTMAGRVTYIAEPLSSWPTQGLDGFFRGDTSKVDPEWHVIGPDTREALDAHYFDAPYIPKPIFFEVWSGSSGWLTSATGATLAGAVTMTLTSVDGLVIGETYGVTPFGQDGTVTDTITISNIVGATITFAPALTTNYPNAVPSAGSPGRATLLKSARTWNGIRYNRVFARATGGGDIYSDIARMVQGYQPLDGQTHIFETGTVGQYGGSIDFAAGSGGSMATGWESQYNDAGEDVAVFAQIDSFNRTNDAGARSAVWIGVYLKNGGTVPTDVAHAVGGAWRVVIDTVKADLTEFATPGDNGNVVLNTALGHRWVMNSTADVTQRGGSDLWGTFYGNVMGDMFIESATDGISDMIQFRFNRAAPNDGRLRIRPTVITTNKSIQAAGTIESQDALVCGTANPMVVFGPGLGVWIEWDGANLRATKTAGAAWVNIV